MQIKMTKSSTSKSSYYNYKPNRCWKPSDFNQSSLESRYQRPQTQGQTLSVVDAVTFITCTDPNRAQIKMPQMVNVQRIVSQDFIWDSTGGLCTQCEWTTQPNAEYRGCGQVMGDWMAGLCRRYYALSKIPAIAVTKSGCMDDPSRRL